MQKRKILTKRYNILKTISDYINQYLNPSKHSFYDVQRVDYIEPKSIEEILNMLDINVDVYYRSLEISDDNDFQIHLRRTPNSCFINNYFRVGLEAWVVNMDIQPVFNEKKAVAYMCAYLSKSEDTCSNAMKQAIKVSIENKCSNYEQMKAKTRAYSRMLCARSSISLLTRIMASESFSRCNICRYKYSRETIQSITISEGDW